MANRSNYFLLKRSNVLGKIPSLTGLTLGEVALNTADAKLYSIYTGGFSGGTEVRQIGWDRLSTLSGGTVTGNVNVNGTLSATTYYGDGSNLTGLVTSDYYVTGGTYSNGTLTLDRQNGSVVINGFLTGSTGGVTGDYLPLSGGTLTGDLILPRVIIGDDLGGNISVNTSGQLGGHISLGDSNPAGYVGFDYYQGLNLSSQLLNTNSSFNNGGFKPSRMVFTNYVNGLSFVAGNAGATQEFYTGGYDTTHLRLTLNDDGLKYASDYSSNYTNRSLPDVNFVTGYTQSQISGITVSGNYLPLSGGTMSNGAQVIFNNAIDIQSSNVVDYSKSWYYGDTTYTQMGFTANNYITANVQLVEMSALKPIDSAIYQINVDSASEYIRLLTTLSGNSSVFTIKPNTTAEYSNSQNLPINYYADYSSNYTDRSLVDKGYVDTQLKTPRHTTITSSATPTPNADTTDLYTITALSTGATFGAPTGTPVEGQSLLIRIKDNGTDRSLGFNAAYRFSSDLPAPTTTIINKTLYLAFVYNEVDTKWDNIGQINNF